MCTAAPFSLHMALSNLPPHSQTDFPVSSGHINLMASSSSSPIPLLLSSETYTKWSSTRTSVAERLSDDRTSPAHVVPLCSPEVTLAVELQGDMRAVYESEFCVFAHIAALGGLWGKLGLGYLLGNGSYVIPWCGVCLWVFVSGWIFVVGVWSVEVFSYCIVEARIFAEKKAFWQCNEVWRWKKRAILYLRSAAKQSSVFCFDWER